MVYVSDSLALALIGPLGPWELALLAVLGILIFGKRLPEVGKSIGRGIVEFKKGLSGIEDDIDKSSSESSRIESKSPSGSVMNTQQGESKTTSSGGSADQSD